MAAASAQPQEVSRMNNHGANSPARGAELNPQKAAPSATAVSMMSKQNQNGPSSSANAASGPTATKTKVGGATNNSTGKAER